MLKRVLYSSCVDKNEYLDVHDELEDKVNTQLRNNYKRNRSLEKQIMSF